MRNFLIVVLTFALTISVNAEETKSRYEVEIIHISRPYKRESDGKIVWDARFRIRTTGKSIVLEDDTHMVVIEENRQEVHRFELRTLKARKMTLVLTLDISGSMNEKLSTGTTKMEEAQKSALQFLNRVDDGTSTGLILFDHRIKEEHKIWPVAGKERQKLKDLIEKAKPDGGTAYLDATLEALKMFDQIGGNKAVVLMTDGVDLSPDRTVKVQKIIDEALQKNIPVYTIGVGDTGIREPVTTILVLDQSGSMGGNKITSLKLAAKRFVELMRDDAKATLLPFNSKVDTPGPFTSEREALKVRIDSLKPTGQTHLFDAALDGIDTISAQQQVGKRSVVILTDGEDNGSRRRVGDVINRAREATIPLYTMGLGPKGKVGDKVLQQMATETGGKYFHIEDPDELFKIFERLSLDLHGEGIDEKTLRELADKTKGKYYHVRDASKLDVFFGELAKDLDQTYTVTFPSLKQEFGGSNDAIKIYVVDKSGKKLSDDPETSKARPGIVVPEMDYLVYLILFALLLGLLALPAGIRRWQGS